MATEAIALVVSEREKALILEREESAILRHGYS